MSFVPDSEQRATESQVSRSNLRVRLVGLTYPIGAAFLMVCSGFRKVRRACPARPARAPVPAAPCETRGLSDTTARRPAKQQLKCGRDDDFHESADYALRFGRSGRA